MPLDRVDLTGLVVEGVRVLRVHLHLTRATIDLVGEAIVGDIAVRGVVGAGIGAGESHCSIEPALRGVREGDQRLFLLQHHQQHLGVDAAGHGRFVDDLGGGVVRATGHGRTVLISGFVGVSLGEVSQADRTARACRDLRFNEGLDLFSRHRRAVEELFIADDEATADDRIRQFGRLCGRCGGCQSEHSGSHNRGGKERECSSHRTFKSASSMTGHATSVTKVNLRCQLESGSRGSSRASIGAHHRQNDPF